jgi:hypothetical protein
MSRPCHVIVGVWMNFSDFARFDPRIKVSAVTQFTEGLLQNYFDYLFGTGDPLDDPAGG